MRELQDAGRKAEKIARVGSLLLIAPHDRHQLSDHQQMMIMMMMVMVMMIERPGMRRSRALLSQDRA